MNYWSLIHKIYQWPWQGILHPKPSIITLFYMPTPISGASWDICHCYCLQIWPPCQYWLVDFKYGINANPTELHCIELKNHRKSPRILHFPKGVLFVYTVMVRRRLRFRQSVVVVAVKTSLSTNNRLLIRFSLDSMLYISHKYILCNYLCLSKQLKFS